MEKDLRKELEELKRKVIKLEKLAYTDNLTGCYNRNWFFKNVKIEDKWHITMIDVNNLKKVNDTQGHVKGDRLLIDIVEILKDFGTVVRYGGDEFFVLTKSEEKYVGLNTLKNSYFSTGGVLASEYTSIDDAIVKADTNLYKNKIG